MKTQAPTDLSGSTSPSAGQGPSRASRFAWALISDYVLLALAILYSLLNVPLGLFYMSKPEFGLWALALQFTSFVVLIDIGMTAAIMRTLVDHKDDRQSDRYGNTVVTGALANFGQGLLIIAAGIGASFFVASWFNVDPELGRPFAILVLGQSIITGIKFMARPLNLMLAAHQRQDLVNWIESAMLILSTAVLWAALWAGHGILSILWAQGAALSGGIILLALACIRTKVLPEKGHWGKPCKREFLAMFTFGRDVFLYIVGTQVINASQIILVSRVLGLEAGAVWAVCIRSYNLVIQFTSRICESSGPIFNEMWVRQEKERFLSRFRTIVVVSASLAAFAGVMLALCNQPFVDVWTSGRIAWPQANNLLLGLMVILQILTRSYTSLAGQTKNFTHLRYIYFIEGILFISVALACLPRWGTTGLIASSIVCTCLLSFPVSLRLVSRTFKVPPMQVLFGWSKPMLRLILFFIPIALINFWLFSIRESVTQCLAYLVFAGIPGAILFLTCGIEREVKEELLRRFFENPLVGRIRNLAR